MKRLSPALVALALLCAPAGAATFPEETPYTAAAFETAQKAGEPILVHVTASWCSTCTAQKPVVDKLRAEPRFSNLKVFNVDFDGQKAALHKLDVRQQSTLIVFKGGREAGRSTGETAAAPIAALLAKAE